MLRLAAEQKAHIKGLNRGWEYGLALSSVKPQFLSLAVQTAAGRVTWQTGGPVV